MFIKVAFELFHYFLKYHSLRHSFLNDASDQKENTYKTSDAFRHTAYLNRVTDC